MRIGSGVVLVAVNLAALPILLMLDLIVLSGRQSAAIGRAIAARLVVDGCLVAFDMGSLSSRQLARVNSLIDAILLAILARVHAHPLRVGRGSVVDRRIVAAVDPGVILMRDLIRCPPDMLLAHRRAFPGVWKGTDAALAIEAGVIVLPGVDEAAIRIYPMEAMDAHARLPCCKGSVLLPSVRPRIRRLHSQSRN